MTVCKIMYPDLKEYYVNYIFASALISQSDLVNME